MGTHAVDECREVWAVPKAVVVAVAVVRPTAMCATVDALATPEGGVNDAW